MRYNLPVSDRVWGKVSLPIKWCAGKVFDTIHGNYAIDGLEFFVPRGLTSPRDRAQFMVNTYEREERVLAASFLTPDMVVLELGGCIGVLSCVINSRLADPTRHVVLEANPALIPYLRGNREINGRSFQIRHAVISRRDSEEFFVHQAIVGGSLEARSERSVTVSGTTVAALEEELGSSFTALVMDIEGGELDVLESNPDLVKALELCIVEIHDFILGEERAHRCRQLLSDAGLTMVERTYMTEAWVRVPARTEMAPTAA